MQRTRGGYTIVEVLIVLAITAILFIAAAITFRGKQTQTQFNQAMYDLDSKLRSYVTEVQSGVFPDASSYQCDSIGSPLRPVLSMPPSGPGNFIHGDCIFLGRTVQVTPGDRVMYIYTVLGNRTIDGGTVASTTVDQANPEPIFGGSGPDLTETYNLGGDATVVSSKVAGAPSNPYNLIGLYSTPESDTGSSFVSRAYPLPPDTDPKSPALQKCIEQVLAECDSTGPTTFYDFSQWTLCIQSADGNRKAFVTVSSNRGGINTQLTFNDCS